MTFLSYFDSFSDDPSLVLPEVDISSYDPMVDSQALLPDLFSELTVADMVDGLEADDGGEWSYRNETAGVGVVMDPSATDWQDMVWIDWT